MENKTHWKKAFKSDYLSSSDIDDKDLILTIEKVVYKQCTTQSGKKYCNVAIFKGSKFDDKGKCISGTKPMILNVTNSKIVKKFSGNKTHLEDWNNIQIQVYVDARVRFGNETVEGLRIRPEQPKQQKQKTALSKDKYDAAVEFLKNGKTMEDLKKHYTIDAETEKKLKEDSKKNE